MEYISGRDMSRIIPKAEKAGIPFPMIYALRIASNVCEGLYYAHTKTDAYGNPLHVVHRDITPENILVGFNGTVKIVDFGIAKANTQIEQTRAGEIKGKLSYMSPEQAMGAQLDARSDIFALGSVVYEWITGYKLFTGENEMAILKSIIDGKIYPPSYFKEDVPEAVERILMKALEKDKEKRYQSAWEMQFDIDTYLASSEFTPSNIHLSNFLKQIFGDEIEREKELVLKQRAALAAQGQPPSAHEHDEEILELEEVGGRALTDSAMRRDADQIAAEMLDASEIRGGNGHAESRNGTALGRPRAEGELRLKLSPQDFEALKRIADAHKTTVDKVAQDLLRSHLKYIT
jgi:serine/threonine-protein kinase